jgi:hypothetical protein
MIELGDNGQGGREYEQYQAEIMARAKAEWMEETNGRISFDDWLDGTEEEDED